MDAIGFALATAFLATVFTVFGIIDRLLVGLVSEIRYTIAPGIANGMRAWGDGPGQEPGVERSEPDDEAAGGTGVTDRQPATDLAQARAVVTQRVTGRTWLHYARLPHAWAGPGR